MNLNEAINEAFNEPLSPRNKKQENSAQFDKASYEADGGDRWIDHRRFPFFENPSDRGLWESVKSESRQIYGGENKAFMIWLYKKRGGKF